VKRLFKDEIVFPIVFVAIGIFLVVGGFFIGKHLVLGLQVILLMALVGYSFWANKVKAIATSIQPIGSVVVGILIAIGMILGNLMFFVTNDVSFSLLR
jgi:hypothetical protein